MSEVSTTNFRLASRTDTGRERGRNEDEIYVSKERGAFLVVDGVGGEDGGDVAAEIAAETIKDRLGNGGPVEERVREGIALANRNILDRVEEESHLEGMSCVLTLAILEEGQVTVGHVGDTRLYVVTPDGIDKKTSDHSFVGVLEEEGELSEQEAMQHPRRNEILREVGTEQHGPHDEDFIDIYDFPFEPESALLLCSDGLTDLVRSDEIQEIVLQCAGNPEKTAESLVNEANTRGGKDNISVIVVEGPKFGLSDAEESTPDATESMTTGGLDTTESDAAPEETESPSSEDHGSTDETNKVNQWWSLGCGGLLGLILGVLFVPLLLWQVPSLQEYDPVLSVATSLSEDEVSQSRRILTVSSTESGRSLQEALDTAQPGDIIEVEAGTYRGPFYMKAGVSLISRDPHETLLTVASQTDSVVVVAQNIDLNRYPTQLIGLRVATSDTSGVPVGVVAENAVVKLVNVKVEGFSRAGIEVMGQASTPEILQSFIVDNPGVGVRIGRGALPTLRDNLITGNGEGLSNGGAGILVEAGTRPKIRNNIIAGNRGNGILTYRREADSLDYQSNQFAVGTLQDSVIIGSPR